jgi:hypothetical protein
MNRKVAVIGATVMAAGWSVFLVAGGDGSTFDTAIRVMGSVGILGVVFLVFKPGGGDNEMVHPGDPPFDADVYDSVSPARGVIITLTIALTAGSLYYRLSQDSYLHQTSAFFIGLPAILAITLALTPRSKSATGMIMKGMTLALLLSGVVLQEGVICILMAAPIFYAVGAAIGVPIDHARKKKRSQVSVVAVLGVAAVIMSLEGVTPATSFPVDDSVTVTRTVSGSVRDVRSALARAPRFEVELPAYLKLGFPRPVAAHGRGLDVGDRRVITFGDESPMEPMAAETGRHHHHGTPVVEPGQLVLEVARVEPGRIVFEQVGDQTAYTHWVSLERSIVEWDAVDANTTRIEWTLEFERRLSPAWYFAPWQRYAAKLAAGYLIDTAATP